MVSSSGHQSPGTEGNVAPGYTSGRVKPKQSHVDELCYNSCAGLRIITTGRLHSGGSRGGGVQGVRTPPPFGPRCRLFNIGPKVGPPPFVNVQEWGCFSNFLRSDDVTRTMSKGGVLVKNLVSVPGPPPPFQKSWIRACCIDIAFYVGLCLQGRGSKEAIACPPPPQLFVSMTMGWIDNRFYACAPPPPLKLGNHCHYRTTGSRPTTRLGL